MKKILAVGSFVSVAAVASLAFAEVASESFQFKGEAASAGFYASDECSTTSAYIWGGEQVAHGSGQPVYSQTANAYAYSFNWCTGEWFDGYGYAESGVAVNALTSATISVPVTFTRTECVLDDGTGEYVCTLTDLGTATFTASLTGTGDTFSGHNHSSYRGGGTSSTSRSAGKYRQATATGNLVLDGQQLAGTASYAELQKANSGYHTVSHF